MVIRFLGFFAFMTVMAGSCQAGDPPSPVTAYLLAHPEITESFCNTMLSAGSDRKVQLPAELSGPALTAALATREGGTEFLHLIYQELQELGDLQLAAAVGRFWIQSLETGSKESKDIEAQVDRFLDDAVLPSNVICEAHFPASRFAVAYLDVTAATSRARALLPLPDLGVESRRERMRDWLDRVNWMTGAAATEQIEGASIAIKGKITLNGQACPLTRIAFFEPTKETISGGGHRSYLSGFDAPPTKSVTPFPPLQTARTNVDGEFQLNIKPNQPYDLAIFIYTSTPRPIEDVVVAPEQSTLRKSLLEGIAVPADPNQPLELGSIDLQLVLKATDQKPRPMAFTRPVVEQPSYAKGSPIRVPVIVENAGDAPLTITSAKTDCSCSELHGSDHQAISFPVTIRPRSMEIWSMEINTSNMRAGNQAKSYLLQTDDPLNPALRRLLTFAITHSVRLDPPLLRFEATDTVDKSGRIVKQVSLVGGTTPTELPPIESAVANRGLVETRVEAGATSFEVLVDKKSLQSRGVIVDIVTVRTKDGTVIELPIQCVSNVAPEVRPSRFAFRGVGRDSKVVRKLILPTSAKVQSLTSANGKFSVVGFTQDGKIVSFEIKLLEDDGDDKIVVALEDMKATVAVTWGTPRLTP